MLLIVGMAVIVMVSTIRRDAKRQLARPIDEGS
jgi:hypothetical protein